MVKKYILLLLPAVLFLIEADTEPDTRDILGPPDRVHVGLIYLDDDKKGDLYFKVAELAREFIREQKNILLRWTVIKIIERKISNSPRQAVEKACELIERGVSTIIFPGPSPLVSSVADIANSFNIPVIAPTATNPFLRDPTHRPLLLQMPPTDDNQSKAIAAILNEYGWIYFSILTSYDPYGINGMLQLQQIASNKKWKILNTQHFIIPKDIQTLNVTKELNVIKKSEARIIVLNCQAIAARRVLQTAKKDFDMVGNGYMWIVTDGVVGNTEEFTRNQNIPEWNGLIGTLPSYKNGKMYNMFVNRFTEKEYVHNLNKNPFAAMVYDSVLIFGHALNRYLADGNPLVEQRILCVHQPCHDSRHESDDVPQDTLWLYGEKLFQYFINVTIEGASRNYTFSDSGDSLNLNYSIMNFKDAREFDVVGTFDSSPSNTEMVPEFNGEKVIFMGPNNSFPEYRPITLRGRILKLGINMEHPFISERTIKCVEWSCVAQWENTYKNGSSQLYREECTGHQMKSANKSDCYTMHHSNNCTLQYDRSTKLYLSGTNCTQCNNSAVCYPCGPGEVPCIECKGNSCYSGYCIDLVEKISKELQFGYQFLKPRDMKWGGYNADTKTWDGLVLDLLDSYIDIATVHFSINAKRQQVIDFSVPFMQVGLAVVVKAEVDSSNEFFFLAPFSSEVWYCVILSAFLITIIVCVYNKISPYGLYGRKMHALQTCPCNSCKTTRRQAKNGQKSLIKYQEYPCLVEEVENYGEDRLELLNMANSGWLVIASLLQQGPVEGAPYCLSGRTILSVWWFFMMILIAMYTANLAAFLTVTRMKVGIKRVEDLLSQNKLRWGTVDSTNPEILLAGSSKSEYQDLSRALENVHNAEAGFERVKKGNYAFIYESALLEYKVQQTCNLVIAGEKFSKFGFAFGFPPNSPYLDLFSNVILKYREKNELEDAWEKIKGSQIKCGDAEKESQSTSKLDMKNLSGLFSVIGLGILLSVIFLFSEYTLACFEDVYGNEFPEDSERPRNLQQAFRRRLKLTWRDIKNHWFIFESFRKLRPPDETEMIHYTELELDELNVNRDEYAE